MKTKNLVRTISVVAIAATLSLVGWQGWTKQRGTAVTTSSSTPVEAAKQACIGRYTFVLPDGAKITGTNFVVDGVKLELLASVTSEGEFEQEVAKRKSELAGQTNGVGKPSLESQTAVKLKNGHAVVFEFGREAPLVIDLGGGNSMKTGEHPKSEAWAWVSGHAVYLTAEAIGEGSKDRVSKMVSLLSADAPSAPSSQAYCFSEGGMALGVEQQKRDGGSEQTEMTWTLRDHPDVRFRIAMHMTKEPTERGLIDRFNAIDEGGHAVTRIRAAKKSVATQLGEEVVESVRESNGSTVMSLNWEGPGKPGNVQYPMIEVEMKTGWSSKGPVQPSINQQTALKIWDALLEGIAIRAGKQVSMADLPPEPRVPLGEKLATGRTCTETGTWQCSELSSLVKGGNERVISKGEVMPAAIVMGEPNLLQRMKGERPEIRRATVWTLIAHGADPNKEALDRILGAASKEQSKDAGQGDGEASDDKSA